MAACILHVVSASLTKVVAISCRGLSYVDFIFLQKCLRHVYYASPPNAEAVPLSRD